jgi:leader peptidase (prepilin peptidase)/N-methyltransferase
VGASMNFFGNDPNILYLQALILGLVIGSFINVVVHRLPVIIKRQWNRDCAELLNITLAQIDVLTLSYPPSHCPKCKHFIRPWENIPIISYILLRGQCSFCHSPISLRYPLTEFICALLTVITVIHFDVTWQTIGALFLTWGLLTLSLIDYDTQLLPDNITLPLLWLGLLANSFNIFVTASDAILGAIVGYLSLWSVFQLFRLITGKEGMGYGDFKLLAMLGAWLGWQNIPQIILLSACTGAVIGIILILIRNHQRDQPIPFGPYLAAAGWINLMWGEQIIFNSVELIQF